MEIFFATGNEGKVISLRRDLEKYGIQITQLPIELSEPRSSDVREITEHKIICAYKQIQKPTIVIDAGFYIPSLNGFPRAFVNFALETIGLEGILKLVDGKERAGEFKECLAYMGSELKQPKYFMITIKGTLAEEQRGVMQKHLWSELSLLFIPDKYNKTLAEMSHEEYKQWKDATGKENSFGELLYSWLHEREIV